jgi:tetratricopeptide (TPR) repeat protein
MAKKKKQQLKPVQKTASSVSRSEKHVHAKPSAKQRAAPPPRWHLPFIIILTLVAYIPALNAGFVNWDDGDYVYDNILIRDASNLKQLLSTSVQGNHHPLTMLSLMFNYMISGNEAWSYHLLSLLLHLVNCWLVYRLAWLLSNSNAVVAFITSLFFAIHPLHVESVAWISERKDVMYSLFFLAGHIAFLKYIDSGSKKQYWLAFLLMLLSLVSKPAAVIFPVSLFCMDILRRRKFSFRLIAEKIPFLIPAVIMGVITVMAQKTAGATEGDPFGIGKSILFGFYGIMMYFVKLIFPFQLSAFYPFPPINESLPAPYYIAPVFSVLLAVLFFYGLKKHRFLSFGISFYIVNLLLVLQVFSVGSAIIAERYTYIPYIGIFYIFGCMASSLAKNKYKTVYAVVIPVALFFSVLTYLQSQTWKDGATLWDSVIKKHPSSRAYSARATLFRKDANAFRDKAGELRSSNRLEEANKFTEEANKLYQKAIDHYTQAVRLNKIDHESHNNRANIYMDLNRFDLAYEDYKQALAIKPEYHVAMDNLGGLYARRGQNDSAYYWLTRAIEKKPDYKPAYSNRALVLMQMNRHADAINDWKKFLQFEPDAADILNTIGLCYRVIGNPQEALGYINRAIQLNPDAAPFYLNRSYAYSALNNLEQARKDALMAKQKGTQLDPSYAAALGIQ